MNARYQLNIYLDFTRRINDQQGNRNQIRFASFHTHNLYDILIEFPEFKSCVCAETFSVDAKIDLKKLNHPDKLKVVVSANGDIETKYLIGKDLNSNTATVSFELNQKNGIVNVGSRDEYFVCAYALNAVTDQMESYSCAEGNIENTDGKNTISLGSGCEDIVHWVIPNCQWWPNNGSHY